MEMGKIGNCPNLEDFLGMLKFPMYDPLPFPIYFPYMFPFPFPYMFPFPFPYISFKFYGRLVNNGGKIFVEKGKKNNFRNFIMTQNFQNYSEQLKMTQNDPK